MATNVSTINHSGEDYATIALWESATDTDLVTAGDIEVLEIYADDGAISQGNVTIAGATTDASNYRIIRAKSGDEWGGDLTPTSVASIAVTTSNAVKMNENYLRIEDIFFDTPTSNSRFPIQINNDNCLVRNCFFDDGSGPNVAGDNNNVTRCVMLNTEDTIDLTGSGNTLSNCTCYGGTYGVYVTAANTLVYNTVSDNHSYHDSYLDGSGSWHSSSDGNMSGGVDFGGPMPGLNDVGITANTSPGAGNWFIVNSITSGSEDFQLVDDTDNDALGYGETLTALESTDAFGNDANTNWDVGAFNLPGATEYTKTVTVNGLLKKSDLSTTATVGGMLQKVDRLANATVNGVLGFSDSMTVTVGGILTAEITATAAVSGITKALDRSITASVSGYIETEVVTDARVAIFESTTGTGTGTRDFTSTKLTSETAKGGLFFCTNATASSASVAHARLSIGWTDGTTHFTTAQNAEDGQTTTDTARLDEAHLIIDTTPGTNNVTGRMAFSALTTNGITGDITTAMDADYTVKCIMFGGTDDCEVKSGSIAGQALNNTVDVTDVGFQPDLVFFFSHDFTNVGSSGNDLACGFGLAWNDSGTVVQRSTQYFSDNSQAVGTTEGVFSDTYACGLPGTYQCEISDFDTSGFSLTARTAPTERVFYLAVRLSGWDISLGGYGVPTTSGTQAYTTPGFTPNVIIEGFTRNTSQDTNQSSGEATAYGFALSDQSEEHTISVTDEDGATTSNTASIESATGLSIYEHDGTTLAAQSTIDSFDVDGYTRDWTTVPGTSFNVWSLCMVATTGAVSYFKTAQAEGFLLDQSKALSTEGEGITQALDKLKTITAHAYVSELHNITLTANALTAQSEITETVTADAVLASLDKTQTASTNGHLKLLDRTQTAGTSGHLKALDTLLTVSVNGRLQGGTALLADATGWLNLVDVTLTANASGMLGSLDKTLTATTNGVVKVLDKSLSTTSDGISKALDKTQTVTAAGHLKLLDVVLTASVNGELEDQSVEHTVTVTTGGVLQAFDQTKACAVEGILYDTTTVVFSATARAALNTSIGTQQITTANFASGTPKAAISITTYAVSNAVEANHAQLCIGFSDGTMDRCVQVYSVDAENTTSTHRGLTSDFIRLNNLGLNTPDIEAAFSSWVSDGIEIDISNEPDAAYLTQLAFFGGSTVEAKVGSVTAIAPNAEQNIDTVGFEPDVVFFINADRNLDNETADNHGSFGVAHNGAVVTQRSIQWEDDDGDSATNLRGLYQTNYVAGRVGDHQIEVGNFDASGFSIWTRTTGARDVAYLALKIPDKTLSVTDVLTSPITGDQALDLDINPDFVLAGISANASTDVIDTTGGGMPVGLWMADGTDEFCSTMRIEDGADPSDTGSLSADSIIVKSDDGTAAFVGSLTSFDNDGLTIAWTAVDPTPRYWWLFTLGDDVSATATKSVSVSGILENSYTISVSSNAFCESQDSIATAGVDALLVSTSTQTSSASGHLINLSALQASVNALLLDTYTATCSGDGVLFGAEGTVLVTVDGMLATPSIVTASVSGQTFQGVMLDVDALLKTVDRTVTCQVDGFILGKPGDWGTVTYPSTPDWGIIKTER